MPEFETVRELYETAISGSQMEKDQLDYVELQGWVRTNRNNGSIGFIELNDGTYFKNAQVVYTNETKGFQEIAKFGTVADLEALKALVGDDTSLIETIDSEIADKN